MDRLQLREIFKEKCLEECHYPLVRYNYTQSLHSSIVLNMKNDKTIKHGTCHAPITINSQLCSDPKSPSAYEG